MRCTKQAFPFYSTQLFPQLQLMARSSQLAASSTRSLCALQKEELWVDQPHAVHVADSPTAKLIPKVQWLARGQLLGAIPPWRRRRGCRPARAWSGQAPGIIGPPPLRRGPPHTPGHVPISNALEGGERNERISQICPIHHNPQNHSIYPK
eukprot:gene12267-biopygen3426